MTRMHGCLLAGLLALMLVGPAIAQAGVAGFEDVGAGLAAESYWNGQSRFDDTGVKDGTFASGGLAFNNHYDEDYGAAWAYWDCFAYSNRTNADPVPDDQKFLGGQYNAIPGAGAGASATYGIGYVGFYGRVPTIEVPDLATVESVMITNTNYAYFTMLEGDPYGFTSAFGDPADGDPNDWLLLTITGKDAANAVIDNVEFYLADYRFADAGDDYIVDDWTFVDLSSLAGSRSLAFTLTGSDAGAWGLNTPAYFAIDNVAFTSNGGVVPEPSTMVIWACGLGLGVVVCRRRRKRATAAA
jgi:hypothetical protein